MDASPDLILTLMAVRLYGDEADPAKIPIIKTLKKNLDEAKRRDLVRIDSRKEDHPTKKTKAGKPSKVTFNTYRLTPDGIDRLCGSTDTIAASSGFQMLRDDMVAQVDTLRTDLIRRLDGLTSGLGESDANHAHKSADGGLRDVPSAPKTAPPEAEVWRETEQAARTLGRDGKLIKIPELSDRVREAAPGLDADQFLKMLGRWRDEDRLALQVCDDPRLEARANEGIRTQRGLLYYVHLMDSAR